MKKAKVVLAQPAARAAGHVRGAVGAGDEAYRARAKYKNLLQDYQELRKETEAKQKRLQMEKLKKQRLLAEVKFLRRRYKSMSENPSQTAVYRVKDSALPPTLRQTACAHDDERRMVHAIGISSKGPSAHRRLDSAPRASPVIDLNEACEPSSEEMEEIHGYQEPVRAGKVMKYPMEGDFAADSSDAKMAAFWDVRSAASRAGKRKISWQDQLALRV
ncbi:hypothetical protein E2562_021351 [Oryza meyeriana var. granulata]|uniref:Uncharacterized protein n=1 Tax=Oryza meyeriana var. granulata TaxID=110450 RepID=A0A6G1CHI2_9ORYZ|nr:hypothetical protein E2562_021351 [Oryza meyeriana var. granulata]